MILKEIRDRQPLVHCLTNYVVANFTANGLLAVGASPVMADEVEELDDIVAIADAVLLNIGTLNTRTRESMVVAGMKANERNIPVVLDPVGVGASAFRKKMVSYLLKQVQVDLIRCNKGELAFLAESQTWQAKGVDSGKGDLDVVAAAKFVALKYSCLVAVTGAEDVVTDGNQVRVVKGGSIQMTEVTGTGCLLGALTAATLTITGNQLDHLTDVLKAYKEVARVAHERTKYLGMFQIEVLNQLNLQSKEKQNECSDDYSGIR